MIKKGKKRFFEKGDLVAIIGKLHPLHRRAGFVMGPTAYKKFFWQVKIGRDLFSVQGRYLQLFGPYLKSVISETPLVIEIGDP